MLEGSDGTHTSRETVDPVFEHQTPERLDRTRILTVAAQIVGQDGLKALTMRRIGTELGVDPTAVYRHFRNKDEILTRLAEWIFESQPELDPRASWQDQMRELIDYTFVRYYAHADLCVLLASQEDDLKPLIDLRETMLELLISEAGLSLEDAALVDHMIENHVVGSGLFFGVSGFPARAQDYGDRMRRAFALLSSDEYPRVTAATPWLFPDPKMVVDRITEMMIELIEQLASVTTEEVRP